MRKKCERAERSPVVQLVGPCLWDAAEAAEAVRLSYGSGGKESIVVVVCGEDRRVLLAVDFEGATAADAAAVAELVSLAVAPGSSLVVGLCRPGGSEFLDRFETEAVQELADICDDSGLDLLYVIVGNDDRWRCLPEFGELGEVGDAGPG